MTAGQWTTVATAASALVAVIGGAWTLSARLSALGAQVRALGHRQDALEQDTAHDIAGIKGTLTTLLRALVQGKALPEGVALEAALAPWHQQIQREHRNPNPLTPEELSRFERYYDKVKRREPLEQSEFEDYQRLADKLYRDRPNDPGVWVLIGLGALLLALGLIKAPAE